MAVSTKAAAWLARSAARMRGFSGLVARKAALQTAASLARVAVSATAITAKFSFSLTKDVVLRSAPKWLARMVHESIILSRAGAAVSRIVTGLKANSAAVKAALDKYAPLIRNSDFYKIPSKPYGNGLINYSNALFWKTVRFTRQHPWEALGISVVGLHILDEELIKTMADDEVNRELDEDAKAIPSEEAKKYSMTDAEFTAARLEFIGVLRRFFPALPPMLTDTELTQFLVALMTQDPVGGVQIYLTALVESGLINAQTDSAVATLVSGIYGKFAAAPNTTEEEHSWMGNILVALTEGVGALVDAYNDSSNQFTEILPMPDLDNPPEEVEAASALREHRKRKMGLARLFGSLRAAAQFGAFVMFLYEKKESGEDVAAYLKDLSEGRG